MSNYSLLIARHAGLAKNFLVPFIADADGRFPRRDDDNILAIHSSAIDVVARRFA